MAYGLPSAGGRWLADHDGGKINYGLLLGPVGDDCGLGGRIEFNATVTYADRPDLFFLSCGASGLRTLHAQPDSAGGGS